MGLDVLPASSLDPEVLMAVLNIAIDRHAGIAVGNIRDVPVSVTELPGMSAIVFCSDAIMLSILHIQAKHLVQLIRSDELFSKVHATRTYSPWAYVIISGDLAPVGGKTRIDGSITNWLWSSIQGALTTVQELGAAVIYTESAVQVPQVILNLGDRKRDAKRIEPLRQTLAFTPGESVLMVLPGVGEERAEQLLQGNTSPAWALVGLTDRLERYKPTPGIGPDTKDKVRRALGLADFETLCIIVEEQSEDGK